MARALLIHNPAAARTGPEVVESICDVFQAEGWTIDAAGTTKTGDAVGLARQGVVDGVDVVAVYGGDGTMMQVVSGMLGSGVPLGVIPGGTGNLLAGNLRLPKKPAEAAYAIMRGVPKQIDLGRVQFDKEVRHFAVACGAGFDAELMAATTTDSKQRWGMFAYVAKALSTIPSLTPLTHRVTVDGDTMEFKAVSVMVLNCGEIIPNFLCFGKDISPDDGLLDMVALNASGYAQGIDIVVRLLTGHANGSDRVRFARGRTIRVECDGQSLVELDGEPVDRTPFTAEVVPGALTVLVPKGGGNGPRA